MDNINFHGNSLKSIFPELNSVKGGWPGKLRLTALISTLVFLIMLLFSVTFYINQRKVLKNKSIAHMSLISAEKAGRLDDYFTYLDREIACFASDAATIEAMRNLALAFESLENDIMITSGSVREQEMKNDLRLYYNGEILPLLEQRSGKKFNFEDFAGNLRQTILQYLYISDNERPAGQKHMYSKAPDNSNYSQLHGNWHPLVADFTTSAGVSDLYLVDYKTGSVVYTYRKSVDFATDLYDGPFSNTDLARVFTGIASDPSAGMVIHTDMSLYSGNMMQPVFFAGAPVFEGSTLTGVVIIAVDVSELDEIMQLDEVSGLRSFVVGKNLKLRSNDPSFPSIDSAYISGIPRRLRNGFNFQQAERTRTAVQTLTLDIPELNLAGSFSGSLKYRDSRGEPVLGSYIKTGPVYHDWMVFTVTDKKDLFSPLEKTTLIIITLSVIALVIVIFISVHFGKMIFSPVNAIAEKLMAISEGFDRSVSKDTRFRETSCAADAADKLAKRIDEMVTFVSCISRDNYDVTISSSGDNDRIAEAFNMLKGKVISTVEEGAKRKKEEEVRNWSSESLALFNDILRADHDNLEKLSLNIIRNLINTLKANQGGLFLIAEEDGRKYLNLEASVAYDRQKFHKKIIEIGEGLAGECVLEKQTIVLNKVPDDYIHITSGLGGSRPGALVIVPLKKDDNVMGVIELASFNHFMPHEVEFLEKIAENITETIINVRLNVQNIQLVERFQQQAEEMKAQEEELRQNIEELRATHEQIEKMKAEDKAKMDRMIKEMENNRDLLIHVLDNIPGKIFVKDRNGVLLLLNSEVAKVYHKKVNEMIGTSDFDNHPYEQAKEYREKELEILSKGGETYIQEETLTGNIRYLQTTKKPFRIPGTGETGLLGFQIDVTETRRLQDIIEKLKKEIVKLKSV